MTTLTPTRGEQCDSRRWEASPAMCGWMWQMKSTSLEFGLNPFSGNVFFQVIKLFWTSVAPFWSIKLIPADLDIQTSNSKTWAQIWKNQDSRALESAKTWSSATQIDWAAIQLPYINSLMLYFFRAGDAYQGGTAFLCAHGWATGLVPRRYGFGALHCSG